MIQIAWTSELATIRVEGRFDFRCVKSFNAALERRSNAWVVDLGGVDYVDSAALGLLLLLRERADKRVTLQHVRGQPRDVLLMAKFDQLFELED